MAHPERIIPDETSPGILAIHLKRYDFARPLCDGARVLDAACGVGYGSAYLATEAAEVVGIDISEEAIVLARSSYARANVSYMVMDVTALDLDDQSFDVVCSFETIEHIRQPDAAIAEAARVLRTNGTYIVSTPRADQTLTDPANPYHEVEFSVADFRALLDARFGSVELYGQWRRQTSRHRLLQRLDVLGLRRSIGFARASAVLTGTRPTTDLTLDDVALERDRLERATEVVAVCRQPLTCA